MRMKILVALLILNVTSARPFTINLADDVDCGLSKFSSNRPMRIVNGHAAAEGEFPWVVSLKLNRHHFCGGVLLNKRWILTAAHCFTNKRLPSQIRVDVGEIARFINTTQSPSVSIEQVIVHPSFVSIEHGDDIALVRLQEDVTWNELVQPICLSDIAVFLEPKQEDLPSGDFGLLEETSKEGNEPSTFLFSNIAFLDESQKSNGEHQLNFSDTPRSFLEAVSRLFTGEKDRSSSVSEHLISSDRNENAKSLLLTDPIKSQVIDNSPFHPRDISSGIRLTNDAIDVSSSPLSGLIATVVGWGYNDEKEKGGQRANTLQKAVVPILSNEQCQTWFKEEAIKEKRKLVVISDRRVCAGFESGGKDSCTGDSGGPLMIKQKGRYMVVGIVSTGIGCGRPKLPGLYTRVNSYLDWITQTITSK